MSNRNMLQNADFTDMVHNMDNADGVFITCTLKTGDALEHRILMEDFPKADILSSLAVIREKSIYDLEHPPKVLPPKGDVHSVNAALSVKNKSGTPVQVKPVRGVRRSGD